MPRTIAGTRTKAGTRTLAGARGLTGDIGNVVTNGLVGYWKMDEILNSWNGTSGEVKDSSGNNNNGTDSGFSSNSPVAGKFGNAGSFSGTHVVTVTHATSINNLTNLTYNIWMYPTAIPLVSVPERLFDKSTGNTGPVVCYINGQTVNVTTYWTTTNPYTTTRSPMSIVPLNTWTMLTLTFNGTTAKWDIYLNGVKALYPITGGQVAGVGTPIDDSGAYLYIGNSGVGGNRAFIGSLDDVRIYNRALSADEVKQLYLSSGVARSVVT